MALESHTRGLRSEKKEKGISAVAWSWKDSVSHYTKPILTNLGFTASPNSKIKYKVRRK